MHHHDAQLYRCFVLAKGAPGSNCHHSVGNLFPTLSIVFSSRPVRAAFFCPFTINVTGRNRKEPV